MSCQEIIIELNRLSQKDQYDDDFVKKFVGCSCPQLQPLQIKFKEFSKGEDIDGWESYIFAGFRSPSNYPNFSRDLWNQLSWLDAFKLRFNL